MQACLCDLQLVINSLSLFSRIFSCIHCLLASTRQKCSLLSLLCKEFVVADTWSFPLSSLVALWTQIWKVEVQFILFQFCGLHCAPIAGKYFVHDLSELYTSREMVSSMYIYIKPYTVSKIPFEGPVSSDSDMSHHVIITKLLDSI
jgi:hypothetical protein